MRLYKVFIHNDDHVSMEHVVGTLKTILKLSHEKAMSFMLRAHQCGMAACKIENMELAELHRDQLSSRGLTVTIEPCWTKGE